MTTSGGLILETNLESYFHERVRDARQISRLYDCR